MADPVATRLPTPVTPTPLVAEVIAYIRINGGVVTSSDIARLNSVLAGMSPAVIDYISAGNPRNADEAIVLAQKGRAAIESAPPVSTSSITPTNNGAAVGPTNPTPGPQFIDPTGEHGLTGDTLRAIGLYAQAQRLDYHITGDKVEFTNPDTGEVVQVGNLNDFTKYVKGLNAPAGGAASPSSIADAALKGALLNPEFIPIPGTNKAILRGSTTIVDMGVPGSYKPTSIPGVYVDQVTGTTYDSNGVEIQRGQLKVLQDRLDLDRQAQAFTQGPKFAEEQYQFDTGVTRDYNLAGDTNRRAAYTSAGDIANTLQKTYDTRGQAAAAAGADPGNFVQREYLSRALLPKGNQQYVDLYKDVPEIQQALSRLLNFQPTPAPKPNREYNFRGSSMNPGYAPGTAPTGYTGQVSGYDPGVGGGGSYTGPINDAIKAALEKFAAEGAAANAGLSSYAKGGTTNKQAFIAGDSPDGMPNPEVVIIGKDGATIIPLSGVYAYGGFAPYPNGQNPGGEGVEYPLTIPNTQLPGPIGNDPGSPNPTQPQILPNSQTPGPIGPDPGPGIPNPNPSAPIPNPNPTGPESVSPLLKTISGYLNGLPVYSRTAPSSEPAGVSGNKLNSANSTNSNPYDIFKQTFVNSDESIQNLPTLQYLLGLIGGPEWGKLSTGTAQGAFGTQLPEAGLLNYATLSRIQSDPVAYAMLSSLYRSASRSLPAEASRAFARAPIGNAPISSLVRT